MKRLDFNEGIRCLKINHAIKMLSLFFVFPAMFLTGCEDVKKNITKEDFQPPEVIILEQGWTPDERVDFYNTSQGSQLIPYSWFLALEQSDNESLFRDKENIKQLGYIPQQIMAQINPDGLPIGFVKDDNMEAFLSSALSASRLSLNTQGAYTEYKEWLGLTCAACHVSEISYNDQTLRIDGGPPMSDFQSMIKALSKALTTTINDDAKLTRFAKKVLAEGGYNEGEQQRLKTEVAAYTDWLNNYIKINYDGLAAAYGYGRLDAFGAILNRVTATLTDIEDNATPANAPVSYPFLWNTSRLSWVQWNGSANNHIGRNVGEVTGVFGHTIVNTGNDDERFYSSAKIVNLDRLEQLMSKLDSPEWRTPLPAIDHAKAKQGKALFARNCVMCHSIRDEKGEFPMTDPNPVGKQFIKIHMTGLDQIGTDPLMAMNFINPALNVDPGIVRSYLPKEYQSDAKVPRGAILTAVVENVIKKQIAAFVPPLDQQQRLELAGYHLPVDQGGPRPPNLTAYKARPLNGVWATAPYLHNGSVPNLYQLLLPDTEREKSFYVGSKEFDTEKVGFKPTQNGNRFLFNTVNEQGDPIPGNGNYGHSGKYYTQTRLEDDKWRNYTDEERMQLIEYMKTL